MKRFTLKKKIVAGAAVAALVVGVSGAAFAYFTAADGSSGGAATVGSSQAWTVTAVTESGGPLYPDSGVATDNFQVNNPGSSTNLLSHVTTTVDNIGGLAVDSTSHAAISNCQATWFHVVDNFVTPVNVAGGGHINSTSTITLPNITNVDQTGCAGHQVQTTITASSL